MKSVDNLRWLYRFTATIHFAMKNKLPMYLYVVIGLILLALGVAYYVGGIRL